MVTLNRTLMRNCAPIIHRGYSRRSSRRWSRKNTRFTSVVHQPMVMGVIRERTYATLTMGEMPRSQFLVTATPEA